MPIRVTCTACGGSTTFQDDRLGERVECPHPGCENTFTVQPRVSRQADPPSPPRSKPPLPPQSNTPDADIEPPRDHDDFSESASIWRNPVKMANVVVMFSSGCLLLAFVFFMITQLRERTPIGLPLLAILFFLAFVLSGILAINLYTAKQRAIASQGRPISLLFGLAQLVSWEQNEGLIFLKDKRIRETIYGPRQGGGLRLIYPILGEEFRAKVPLTVQLTWFKDERVLTRESIQMVVKVAFWWKVADLEKYFFRIDHQTHSLQDRDMPGMVRMGVAMPTFRGRLASAEVWLRTDIEASLRRLISDTSTFLIVSKRAASHLHTGADDTAADVELHPATPDELARRLEDDLTEKVKSYGLELERVEVQEVQLPQTIQQAVDDVWIASTQPTKSRHEAEALRQRLEVLCNLLGPGAVGASEIIAKLPPGTYMTNPLGIVSDLIQQLGRAGPPPPTPPPPPSGPISLPAPPSVPARTRES